MERATDGVNTEVMGDLEKVASFSDVLETASNRFFYSLVRQHSNRSARLYIVISPVVSFRRERFGQAACLNASQRARLADQ